MNLIKMFENAPNVEEYLAGMTILEEGKPGDYMYVVLEGKVEIQVRGKPIDTASPGEIVGEMALIDSMARSASAVALTDCKVTPVNEKQFLFMVQRTPLFSLHVMRVLVDRIRKMDVKF